VLARVYAMSKPPSQVGHEESTSAVWHIHAVPRVMYPVPNTRNASKKGAKTARVIL
jgi:hypothetical protein